ncbi:related to permease of the major facilitator superfamily [Phialocephala subalpina]|uniref:Related to permease of the major facilitator superfamily n=1 Tax=Phialocephala subalpina TaxID=576137 RepID=A0A1L7X5Y8_9HELO|nr:related to permease of the major facilitator superfamily [Phialocephala subalpina]
MAEVAVDSSKPRKSFFQNFRWFDENDTLEERKLIWKLDLLIVPYAMLVYWVKYLDAANLRGNDFSHLQSALLIGNCIGQVPGAYFFPKLPLHIFIPTLDLGWGIFNLLQYRATGLPELMAYRFLIGLFEPFIIRWGLGIKDMNCVDEGPASTLNLDGVNGLAGWRWNFIITSVCTIPLAFVGWFIFPGTPDKPNRFSITKKDVGLAKKRLEKAGHRPPAAWTLSLIKKVFSTWHIYILLFWDIIFWNGSLNTANGGYLLWIKSLKRYSVPEVNNLGATMPAIRIFITLAVCFGSGFFRSPHWAITLAYLMNILGLPIIVIWDVPEPGLWFAFNTTYFANAISSVLYGGITKGYSFVLACAIMLIVMTWVVKYLHDKQERQFKELQESDDERNREGVDLTELNIEVEPTKKD